MKESLDHRERRLTALGDAIDAQIEEGWVYLVMIGKPGDDETYNLLSNIPPTEADSLFVDMLEAVKARGKSKEL
jgi:hypothetical protein